MPLFDKSTEPIYPKCDYGWGVVQNMEIGEGWWVERRTISYRNGGRHPCDPWYVLHHRHPSGFSVGVGHNDHSGTCATCDVYAPDWVKGAMKLIQWSEA